jgi:hypothetical protein
MAKKPAKTDGQKERQNGVDLIQQFGHPKSF